MKPENFKEKIINTKGLMLLMYNHDLVIDKNLDFRMSERKKASIPHLKLGEVLVLKTIDLNTYDKVKKITLKESIVKDAVLSVHADLDEKEITPITIKKNDDLIKQKIKDIQEYMVLYMVNTITDIEIKQIYYKLGIKNAEQLINGNSNIALY